SECSCSIDVRLRKRSRWRGCWRVYRWRLEAFPSALSSSTLARAGSVALAMSVGLPMFRGGRLCGLGPLGQRDPGGSVVWVKIDFSNGKKFGQREGATLKLLKTD